MNENAEDHISELSAKLQFAVDFMNSRGLLDEGAFTFPDGDTWFASTSHKPHDQGGTVTRLITLTNPLELRAHLEAVGTLGPSLHPDVHSADSRKIWNGWNFTVTVGVDANGQPLQVQLWHFASGDDDISAGLIGHGPGHLGLKNYKANWRNRTDIVFPVELLPPVSLVLYPEHTPEKS